MRPSRAGQLHLHRGAVQARRAREEVDAAGVAGLPVSLEGSSDLPFEIAGAVGCADRAEFHPRQVPAGLARALDSRGVAVHEQTRALGVGGGKVTTETGAAVNADHVVVAYPPSLPRPRPVLRTGERRALLRDHRSPPRPAPIGDAPAGRTPWADPSRNSLEWRGAADGRGRISPAWQRRSLAELPGLERYARDRFEVEGGRASLGRSRFHARRRPALYRAAAARI